MTSAVRSLVPVAAGRVAHASSNIERAGPIRTVAGWVLGILFFFPCSTSS